LLAVLQAGAESVPEYADLSLPWIRSFSETGVVDRRTGIEIIEPKDRLTVINQFAERSLDRALISTRQARAARTRSARHTPLCDAPLS
jgi:hypothetical protein